MEAAAATCVGARVRAVKLLVNKQTNKKCDVTSSRQKIAAHRFARAIGDRRYAHFTLNCELATFAAYRARNKKTRARSHRVDEHRINGRARAPPQPPQPPRVALRNLSPPPSRARARANCDDARAEIKAKKTSDGGRTAE